MWMLTWTNNIFSRLLRSGFSGVA